MVQSYSTEHIHNGRSHSTGHYIIVTVMLYGCSLLCVILCQCRCCCQTFSPQTTSLKLLVHHHEQTATATGHNMQLIALLAHVRYKAQRRCTCILAHCCHYRPVPLSVPFTERAILALAATQHFQHAAFFIGTCLLQGQRRCTCILAHCCHCRFVPLSVPFTNRAILALAAMQHLHS